MSEDAAKEYDKIKSEMEGAAMTPTDKTLDSFVELVSRMRFKQKTCKMHWVSFTERARLEEEVDRFIESRREKNQSYPKAPPTP